MRRRVFVMTWRSATVWSSVISITKLGLSMGPVELDAAGGTGRSDAARRAPALGPVTGRTVTNRAKRMARESGGRRAMVFMVESSICVLSCRSLASSLRPRIAVNHARAARFTHALATQLANSATTRPRRAVLGGADNLAHVGPRSTPCVVSHRLRLAQSRGHGALVPASVLSWRG